MKCKRCKREIQENSIYCSWCGHQQLTASNEVRVPVPTHKGNIWYARVMVDGERVYISAATEDEYYAKARAAKSGMVESHKPDNRLVRDIVDEYIRSREGIVSPATIDGYQRKAAHNLQPLMKLRIKDMTESAVQSAIDKDRKSYAGKTIWEAWSLIQSATGVRYSGLKMPSKKPKKKPPVYSEEDIRKIILALADYGGQVECAGLLAMWLSLRRSEIMGLRWIDIKKNAILIRKSRVYDSSHKLVEKDNKNETSTRTIPCDRYILDKLNALPHDGDYVFTISTAGIWQGIDTVCRNAGVEHGYLHGFRHTNATVMEYIGIPSAYANRRGGWVSDHVRQRTYTDLMSEGSENAAKVIDSYFLGLAEKVATQITTQEK